MAAHITWAPSFGTGPPLYVPVDDFAGDGTADPIPDLLLRFLHGGLVVLDGATGATRHITDGGQSEPFFVVRAAGPGDRGLPS